MKRKQSQSPEPSSELPGKRARSTSSSSSSSDAPRKPDVAALRARLAAKKEALRRAKEKAQQRQQQPPPPPPQSTSTSASTEAALQASQQPPPPPPPPTDSTATGLVPPPQSGNVAVIKPFPGQHDQTPASEQPYVAIAAEGSAPPLVRGFDPRLGLPRTAHAGRRRRALNFAEPGSFIERAERQREQDAIRAMEDKMRERRVRGVTLLTETGTDQDSTSTLASRLRTRAMAPVPSVEWWDLQFLGESLRRQEEGPSYGSLEDPAELNLKRITHLVQHPVSLHLPTAAAQAQSVADTPLPMIKAERKKLRRRRRADALAEERTLVLLGLAPTPKPKVKLSNLHRVLAQEAIQDPTAIDRQVRNEMIARQSAHEARNQERKLTKEQRKAKKLAKLQAGAEKELVVCVFRATDLNNPKNEFKVRQNAKQLCLTGCYLAHPEYTIVIAEGGPTAMRKYKKVLLRRIDWKAVEPTEVDPDTGDAPDRSQNRCDLVWEGTVLKRAFKEFRGFRCPSDAVAKTRLSQQGVVHYWTAARTFKPSEAIPAGIDD
mmetsp:Transcript_5442/g.13708  ORF Transcript_5442/g.13708 Transcript_5442/m.13708 type:complete len:546 (+) Transcript_5442:68-1705(+)